MTPVEFPPAERVKLLGSLSAGEVYGSGLAIVTAVGSLALGRLWPWAMVPLALCLWTFAPTRRDPFRVMVPRRMRWALRNDKSWSQPIRSDDADDFLKGVELILAPDTLTAGAAGVIVQHQEFTVVFPVQRATAVLADEHEQDRGYASWGEVLGGLCVERNTELTAEWIGWTDVHHAADPSVLIRHATGRGVEGPASDDYTAFIAGCSHLASEHQVYVWATITKARRLRIARRNGFTGDASTVMAQAAVTVGRTLGAELAARGFDVGELLSPAAIGQLITTICDPYGSDDHASTTRERFGLPGHVGPRRVDVTRTGVATDKAYHRVFALTYPQVAVETAWLWRPLSVDGPKVTTSVFEAVAPSTADRQREAVASRAITNSQMIAETRRGRVRERDRMKVAALVRSELAVATGHQDLDGYTLVVVTGRTTDELDRRCQALRQRLREAGRAGAREMTGEHLECLVAALPIGIRLRRAGE